MNRIRIILISSFALLSTYSFGQNSNRVITTGVPFLLITPDARSAGMGELGVESAQCAPSAARVVVLHEGVRNSRFAVPIGVVGLDEKTPVIAVDLGVDQEDAGEVCRGDVQPSGPSWASIRIRYCP